jgi:16S rRNA (cytosine967-C5)-methyltransferase
VARAARARTCALGLLGERRRRDARARDLLRGSETLAGLPERDRALAFRLVMGCVAATGELDRVIEARLARTAHLEPRVRDALLLAAFELLYLSTPDEVCVSQGVELARGVAPRAAGLANAVLRRVAERDAPALAAARDRVEDGAFAAADLARVGALPEWLCERALASLGPRAAAAWASAALEPSAATVAANRVLVSTDEAERLLADAGCGPVAGPLPGSFSLGAPAQLAGSGLVERGLVLPCALSAQQVALAAAPAPGSRVLEVGQGRGTKTVLLEGAACATGVPCEVVAVEADARKSERAARRMTDAGVADHVRCVAADARALDASLGSFDLVFVDAPCTGTGTLARHPEIAWSLEAAAVHELADLQLQILSAVASRVDEGGALVYATCSILAEEDERVAEEFLASDAGCGFELVSQERTSWPGSDIHFHAHLRRRL